MTTHALFHALVSVTNDLQAEADRLRFSPAKLALAALVARLNAVLDQIVDEGIHDTVDVLPRLKSRDSQNRPSTPGGE